MVPTASGPRTKLEAPFQIPRNARRRTMQLGMIGLGRMGANIVRRLMRNDHACFVYDRDPAPGKTLAGEGAHAVGALSELVSSLDAPRAIWVMLPAGGPAGKKTARPGG